MRRLSRNGILNEEWESYLLSPCLSHNPTPDDLVSAYLLTLDALQVAYQAL
jgi:hypothetical protein